MRRAAILILALATSVHAATFTVTSRKDQRDTAPGDGVCDAGGGTCTLRAAVQESNALGGANSIVLPAGRLALTLAGEDDDARSGDLDVLGTLTITGKGAGTTSIDAAKAKDRAFDVRPGATLDLGGVTILRGRVRGRDVGGGGLRTMATLMLHDAVVTRCRSDDDSGALDVQGGDATLVDVKLLRNQTGDDGGAIDVDGGHATLRRVVITRNRAADEGGGLENSGGAVTLEQVVITRNRATTDAGGISIEAAATTMIVGCTIARNRAAKGGGIFTNDMEGGASTTVLKGTTMRRNKSADCDGPLVDGGANRGDVSCGFAH